MRFFQCKCGNSTAWTSMGVASCSRCSKCGSDLAEGPTTHNDPEPHRFVTKYDQNTGQPYEVCDRCFRRKSELEETGELDAPPSTLPEGQAP